MWCQASPCSGHGTNSQGASVARATSHDWMFWDSRSEAGKRVAEGVRRGVKGNGNIYIALIFLAKWYFYVGRKDP